MVLTKKDIIIKLLRNYKFSNFPLDSLVKKLFELEEIPLITLTDSCNETLIFELTSFLVKFKFNKLLINSQQCECELEKWIAENKTKFIKPCNHSWSFNRTY